MNVHVVMCNDYPEAVFSDIVEAHAYCIRKRTEDLPISKITSIYWRVYHFELDKEVQR